MGQSSELSFGHKVSVQIERPRKLESSFRPHGYFHITLERDGKIIHEETVANDVVNVGKNAILDSYFRNQAPPTNHYLAFIDAAAFSALAAGDTMGSHAGWAEATGYSEGTRPEWVTTAAASQLITNPTPATFTISGTATLKGLFAVTENTKSGSSGVLWATVLFAGDIPVAAADILKISYTVNAG